MGKKTDSFNNSFLKPSKAICRDLKSACFKKRSVLEKYDDALIADYIEKLRFSFIDEYIFASKNEKKYLLCNSKNVLRLFKRKAIGLRLKKSIAALRKSIFCAVGVVDNLYTVEYLNALAALSHTQTHDFLRLVAKYLSDQEEIADYELALDQIFIHYIQLQYFAPHIERYYVNKEVDIPLLTQSYELLMSLDQFSVGHIDYKPRPLRAVKGPNFDNGLVLRNVENGSNQDYVLKRLYPIEVAFLNQLLSIRKAFVAITDIIRQGLQRYGFDHTNQKLNDVVEIDDFIKAISFFYVCYLDRSLNNTNSSIFEIPMIVRRKDKWIESLEQYGISHEAASEVLERITWSGSLRNKREPRDYILFPSNKSDLILFPWLVASNDFISQIIWHIRNLADVSARGFLYENRIRKEWEKIPDLKVLSHNLQTKKHDVDLVVLFNETVLFCELKEKHQPYTLKDVFRVSFEEKNHVKQINTHVAFFLNEGLPFLQKAFDKAPTWRPKSFRKLVLCSWNRGKADNVDGTIVVSEIYARNYFLRIGVTKQKLNDPLSVEMIYPDKFENLGDPEHNLSIEEFDRWILELPMLKMSQPTRVVSSRKSPRH